MRLLIYIIFVGTFLSCADAKETNEATIINRTTRKSADTLRNGSFPIFDEPSTDATAQQFAFKVNEIDACAMRSNKIDTKITIDGVSNTPVTIWYDKKHRPIKIEYGVTDESGDFTGVFKMYFITGNLWCADWLFAKYVFDEDHHLRYWLNENWKISETETGGANFKEKENIISKTLLELLNPLTEAWPQTAL